jgi:hypothetical protein
MNRERLPNRRLLKSILWQIGRLLLFTKVVMRGRPGPASPSERIRLSRPC